MLMKKNRRNRTHQVCSKRKKEETPKKQESVLTVSIEIPESLNNKEEILQELLKPIVIKKPNNNQLLTKADSVQNCSSSDIEIIDPVSASVNCGKKKK